MPNGNNSMKCTNNLLAKRMKKCNKRGRCVICGQKDVPLTDDHLPPKSFFSKPRPNNINLITVRACYACNGGSCTDDEWFKVIAELAQKRILKAEDAIFRETLNRTLKSSPHIPKEIIDSMSPVYLPTGENGEFEEKHSIDIDYSPIYRTSERILKGLFYKHTGEYFSDGYRLKQSIRNEIKLGDKTQEFFHTYPDSFTKVNIVSNEFHYSYFKYDTSENTGIFIVLNFLGGLETYGQIHKALQPVVGDNA